MSQTEHHRTQPTSPPSRPFWSLRRRLLTIVSGVVLATLVVIAASVLYIIFQNEQQSWQERQADETGQAAELVAQFIRRNLDTLFLISLVERANLESQPELANDLLQQNPDLLEIIRLDENGRVLASGYQDLSLLANLFTLKQAVWFKASKAGQTYLSVVQLSSDSEPYIIMSIPAPDGGVVAARLQLNVLKNVVTNLHFGQTGRAYVVSSEGVIVAHEEPEVVLAATTLAGRPEMEALLHAPNRAWAGSYQNFKGDAVIGVTALVKGTDWIIITEVFQSEVTAASRTALLLLAGGLFVFGGLLILILGRFLGQLVLQPMDQIRTGAERIGRGDLAYRIKLDRQDELGQVAAAFNQMADELRGIYDNLDNQIVQRTQRLEATASLGEQLIPLLNLDELLNYLVTQIQARFGYYHAHVYLLDQAKEMLVVAAGTGQPGAEMKAKGHSIPLKAPISLVARAARNGRIVNVDNVREAKDWLPNPLLPATLSEMAVPIISEGQVVGVLDVQQNRIAGMDEGDASLLRTLANQVAAGMRNARQFEQVQNALAEAQAIQAKFLEQTWDKSRLSRFTAAQAEVSLTKTMAGQGTTSALVPVLTAPIELHRKTIGQLELEDSNPQRVWSEDELALINAVVDQVAQTADNLRLFEEIRARASREQLIGHISDRLRRAPDMETLLKTGVEEIFRVLGPARTFVQLGSAEELAPQPEAGAAPPGFTATNGHGDRQL